MSFSTGLPPEHTQKLIKKYAHLSAKETADKMGLAVTTIRTYRGEMIRAGLLPRKRKMRVTHEDIDRMRRLAGETGLSIPAIAQCIGINRTHCASLMARHGIKPGVRQAINIRAIIDMFGVSKEAICQWRDQGWLVITPCIGEKYRSGIAQWTTREDIKRFLHVREAWPTYAPSLIADPELRGIAEHVRRLAKGHWIGFADIAAMSGETANTVSKRVHRGWLADWIQTRYGRTRYFWFADGATLPPYQEHDRWAKRRENEAARRAT